LLHDWLAFFKAHWPAVSNDYNRLQQRRLATCSALDLAHRYARRTPTGLSKQGEKALTALLDQLATSTETAGDKIDWQLPTTNPFLASMDDGDNVEGAIYLRWHLQSPQPSLWQMFDQSLRTLADDARQAGVNLAFSAYGDYWQLRLVGLDAPMPAILQQALQLLRSPGDAALARYGQTIPEPAAIPIRQLLKCLPDQYLNSVVSQQSRDAQSVWAAAHWISFTTGVSEQRRQSLNSVLQQAPGTADQQALRLSPMNPGKHWQTEPSDSSESAILLFCPTPTLSAPDEAAWRLLAHLAQSPFYQRLRVELQLGYAVFSGFRQIAGQGGLLFGVQSPSASVRQLMRHLTDFIESMPKLIDATDLQTQQKILAAQLDSADMESPTEAEMLWQAHLAGHGADYATLLHKAIISLGQPELHAAADQLEKATAGWLILSNASCGTP
jgi:secreted Zn-dependent insulinase-like peptidase